MPIDLPTLATILSMAAVTYATRVSGYWLVGHVHLSSRVEAGLRAIPGAVLISIVAPTVLTTGPAEAVAGLLTVVVAARTKNLLAAMAIGVVVVWILRTLLSLR